MPGLETWYYMICHCMISKVPCGFPLYFIYLLYIYILLFFIISTLFHCMELRYRLLASQWGPHLHRSEKTQLWGIVPRLRSQSFELKPIIFPGLDKFNVLETTSPLYSVFDPRWPLCCLLHTNYYSDVFLSRSLGKMQALSGKSNGITPCGKNIHELYNCIYIEQYYKLYTLYIHDILLLLLL